MEDGLIIVIISSFATLLAVGISHLISEYRKYKTSLYGLVCEIESNIVTINDIYNKLRLDLEHNLPCIFRTDKGVKDAKFAITLKRLDTFSYNFFKNNGYFVKIDPNVRNKIEEVYWDFEYINRLIDFYNYLKEDKKERWDSETIKNHELILSYIEEIREIATSEFRDKIKKISFKI